MATRIFAGVACFLAAVAIVTAWVAQSRYERVSRDLRDQQDVSLAQGRLNDAQARLNKELYRSQMMLLYRAATGPSRSLAAR